MGHGTKQQAYDRLIKEYRCVTCPNQNIADSGAPIAVAMREVIAERLEKGDSEENIREYLISRYGEYVVYRPSNNSHNVLLWWGPLGMLVTGIGVWYFLARTR